MNSKNRQKLDIQKYVIQPNVISQAIYNLGPYPRKLIAMAMSQMSPDEGTYTASFKVVDFIAALGLEFHSQGGETKKYIKMAVTECLDSHIEINHPNGDWEGYTWFIKSKLEDFKFEWEWGWGTIHMTFNPELGEIIKAFKKAYAKIELADLGKLQSRYAIRFYELALSYAGFAGKDGNRSGEWYFEKTIDNLRMLFQVEKKRYSRTGNFRVKVIDNPIEEINGARIGLRIEPEYKRQGKRLIGVRFHCRWVKKDEALPVTPTTETEQEEEKIIQAYPEEYEKYYQEELKIIREQPGLFQDSGYIQEMAAKARAVQRILEAHPEENPGRNGQGTGRR